MNLPTSVPIKKIYTFNGLLTVSETLPFVPKRIFWVTNLSWGDMRGGHAHKECHQILYIMTGGAEIRINQDKYKMCDATVWGMHIPPLNWVEIDPESENVSFLVLASHPYEEADYIRKYEDFIKLRNPLQQPDARSSKPTSGRPPRSQESS